MLKINGENYEVIYHYVYTGSCSTGVYVPIMLRKVSD